MLGAQVTGEHHQDITSLTSSGGEPGKRGTVVNSQVSEPRQGKDHLGNSSGYNALSVLFSQTLCSLAGFHGALSSIWTWCDISRNIVYLITHLNATQLFLQAEETMFPIITIWPPAMLLSNAS